jgi:uncharacterized membrane protein YozB (DUF420 family)
MVSTIYLYFRKFNLGFIFILGDPVRKTGEKHKKLTRITWPIWFYVAVTGVIVYWMISPYYS